MDLAGLDFQRLLRGLDLTDARVAQAVEEGLTEAAEYVLGEAVRVVPIEEGMLQDSGRTEVSGAVAAIGFGSGPSAPYAVRQHEDTSLRHDPGRTSHYLSGPLVSSRAKVRRILADRIRAALG